MNKKDVLTWIELYVEQTQRQLKTTKAYSQTRYLEGYINGLNQAKLWLLMDETEQKKEGGK